MIYLNNAATTKSKPKEVADAVSSFMADLNVSPSRGADVQSKLADGILTKARMLAAKLINAADSNRIVFTLNATDSLNLAIKGILTPGSHVIISSIEHNSIIRPLRYLEECCGINISIVKTSKEGLLNPENVEKEIKKNTKLVAVLHASNVTGSILPVSEIGKICRENGITFLVDGAQSAGTIPIDVRKMNIDLFAFTGHKALMGPQGTGGLFIREGLDIIPLRHGGTGTSSEFDVQPGTSPDRYESGTPNTPGIAGLAAALEFILGHESDIQERESVLSKQLYNGLNSIKKIKLYGPGDCVDRIPVFSFNIDGMDPRSVAQMLETEFDIVGRAGLHCSPLAHKTIGSYPGGAFRLSLCYYNTAGEIDTVVKAIEKVAFGTCD